MIEDHFVSTGV